MIQYKINEPVFVEEVIDLFERSGLIRPVHQKERIQQMMERYDILVTAWDQGSLVGLARAATDFVYFCYLSELAVRENWKRQGIGKEMLRIVREKTGEGCSLILLSSAEGMEYYPKAGFTKAENAFLIKRKK